MRRGTTGSRSKTSPSRKSSCMPMRLTAHHIRHMCCYRQACQARTGDLVPRHGPTREIIPLPGMYFFDGWRIHPILKIPDNLPQTQDMPVRITARAPAEGAAPTRQTPEDEARDILATAVKNQVECGPGTRRAAVRAIKYLRTLVNRYGSVINEIHSQARLHTQKSKGVVEHGKWYQPTGEALPVISKEVTSELLHCLTALPDPWPLAKITVENQNRFLPKVYTELLNTKRNARFTQCQKKPMASLSLIPFPFALHSLSSSSLAVTHGNTTNQNKDERCHILTLHRFTRFHLEPRMRNIPVF